MEISQNFVAFSEHINFKYLKKQKLFDAVASFDLRDLEKRPTYIFPIFQQIKSNYQNN